MNNNKLSFYEFSKILVYSGELNLEYNFINRVAKHLNQGKDFKSYWMIVKSVVYNSESELRFIFKYEDFPTLKLGPERQKAKAHIREFFNNFMREVKRVNKGYYGYFNSLPRDATEAFNEIQKIKGFGKWAAWKLLDLASCCLDINFDFSKMDLRINYDPPLRGILMLNNFKEKDLFFFNDDFIYNNCLNNVISSLKEVTTLKAPPNYTRCINIQEIETFLCGYHSYIHNKYKPYEDIEKLKKYLANSKYEKIRSLGVLIEDMQYVEYKDKIDDKALRLIYT